MNRQVNLNFRGKQTTDSPASTARLPNSKGHIGYPGRCDLFSRAPKPVTTGYSPTATRPANRRLPAVGPRPANNTASHNNTASKATRPTNTATTQRCHSATTASSSLSRHQLVTAAVYSHGSGESGRKGKAPPFGRRRSLRSRPCARPPPVRWGGCQGKKRGKRGKTRSLQYEVKPLLSFFPLISL